MTIGKKLYMNFGIILAMVVVLFLVNLLAVQREHSDKAGAAASLKLTDNTNAERFQMMQNRLYLSNYLLSGDTREVDRMNEGLRISTTNWSRANRWPIPSRKNPRSPKSNNWSNPGAKSSRNPSSTSANMSTPA